MRPECRQKKKKRCHIWWWTWQNTKHKHISIYNLYEYTKESGIIRGYRKRRKIRNKIWPCTIWQQSFSAPPLLSPVILNPFHSFVHSSLFFPPLLLLLVSFVMLNESVLLMATGPTLVARGFRDKANASHCVPCFKMASEKWGLPQVSLYTARKWRVPLLQQQLIEKFSFYSSFKSCLFDLSSLDETIPISIASFLLIFLWYLCWETWV